MKYPNSHSLVLIVWASSLIFLTGCGSGSPRPVAPPIGEVKVLQPIKPSWTLKLSAPVQLTQSLQVINQKVAFSGATGQVTLVDLSQGKPVWQLDLGKPLQTGAGFDGDSVAVVSVGNELTLVQDGKQLWQKLDRFYFRTIL